MKIFLRSIETGTIIATIFGGVKEVVRGNLCLIRSDLDGYVVLEIISPIRYSHHVIHYIHCLFTLVSDQVAKWFEINIKNVRKLLCSFPSLLNFKSRYVC